MVVLCFNATNTVGYGLLHPLHLHCFVIHRGILQLRYWRCAHFLNSARVCCLVVLRFLNFGLLQLLRFFKPRRFSHLVMQNLVFVASSLKHYIGYLQNSGCFEASPRSLLLYVLPGQLCYNLVKEVFFALQAQEYQTLISCPQAWIFHFQVLF